MMKTTKNFEIKAQRFSVSSQATKFLSLLGYTQNTELWIKTAPSRAVFKAKVGPDLEVYAQQKTQDPEWDEQDLDTRFLRDPRGGCVWSNKGKRIPNGLTYLQATANKGEEIFFVVNHAKGGIGQGHCSQFNVVFFECDDRPIEDQWSLINSFYTEYNIIPCAVIFTGGKSLHVYYKLSEDVSPEQWQELQRKLIVLNNSDPALVNLNREMRLPGFYRKSKGKYQELQFCSDKSYSFDEINTKLLAKFPYGLSQKRFSDWRKNKEAELLICPEEDLPSAVKFNLKVNVKSNGKVRGNAKANEPKEYIKPKLGHKEIDNNLDLIGLVQLVNQQATSEDFEFLFPHKFAVSGGKYRGKCPWHKSKSGTAGWLGKMGRGLTFHCPQCTNNEGLSLFNYFSKLQTGDPAPKGSLFVETAKQFLTTFSVRIQSDSTEDALEFYSLGDCNIKFQPVTAAKWLEISKVYGCDINDETDFWSWVKKNPDVPVYITNVDTIHPVYPTIQIDLGAFIGVVPDAIQQYCHKNRNFFIFVDIPKYKTFAYHKIALFCKKVKSLTTISPLLNNNVFELYFSEEENEYQTNINVNKTFVDHTLMQRWNTRIMAISSPCGTGKTEAMKDVINRMWDEGYTVYFPSHRVALSKAQAARLGFRYIDDPINPNLPPNVRNSLGFVVDSFWSHGKVNLNPFTNLDLQTKKYAVIIDEAEQFFEHLSISNTEIAKHRAEAILYTEFFISHADKIILMDADLSSTTLDYVKRITRSTNSEFFIIRNNLKKGFKCNVYSDKNGNRLLTQLMDKVEKEKLLVLTDSQTIDADYSTQNLESLVQEKYPHLKILRLDKDTIHSINIQDLKTIVQDYDLVIGSPSIATGVDLNLEGYFSAVYGFFKGVMVENSVRQMLFRCRDMNVPRHVWIAKNGLNYPYKTKEFIKTQLFNLINEEFNLHLSVGHNPEQYKDIALNTCESSQYLYSEIVAKITATNLHYRYVILRELEKTGCAINIVEADDTPQVISTELKNVKSQNKIKTNQGIMTAPVITNDTFIELQQKKSLTKDEQYKMTLFLIMNTLKLKREEVTETVINEFSQGLTKKLYLRRLVLEEGGHEKSLKLDLEKIGKMLQSGIVCKQDFNKKQKSILVSLLRKMDISLLLQQNLITTESPALHTLIQVINENRKVSELILGINPKSSTLVKTKKILGLIGVKLVRKGRETKGNRLWIYELQGNNEAVYETIMKRWKEEEQSKNITIDCEVDIES